MLLMDIGLVLRFVKKKLKVTSMVKKYKNKENLLEDFFIYSQLINDGGWHFSFLKDSISIKNKISVYAHQEFNLPKFSNTENIQKKLKTKRIYLIEKLSTKL